jgi:tripartite-type tricarboxylate transporter receptor subunit TctC
MRGRIAGCVAALVLLAWSALTLAEEAYPSRPVRLLVPYPAGGAVDIVARTLGDELTRRWGQSVVIENRPGAGGTIASQAAATAAPDGYTLILIASGHALSPYFYPKLTYDPFNDLAPINSHSPADVTPAVAVSSAVIPAERPGLRPGSKSRDPVDTALHC